MKITIFSEELRECLNAAGLSDCGENDTWNYWYQRLMNAYNESVERQIMTEQVENAKLRESLEKAAGIIADICGECPVSRYEWLSSDGCAEKCGTVTEEECWIAYLTGKRWDESGAEVDVWAK